MKTPDVDPMFSQLLNAKPGKGESKKLPSA